MHSPRATPLKVFYAYARVDAKFRTELSKHLVDLRTRCLIEDFFDGDIESGEDWDRRIRKELEEADLILVLISTDFMTSAYGAGVELARAMQRHHEGTARVVPVLIRPMLIRDQGLSALQMLPRNGTPVSVWPDRDLAYAAIATDIERLVEEVRRNPPQEEQLRLASIARAHPRIPREPVVPFVSRRGRDGEDLVQWISAQLAGPNKPVLALWGGGGVGKTTIASQVARESMQIFKGQIAWVTADGRESYSLEALVDEAGSQLGCPPMVMDREPGARSRQVAALISREPALIVFDNMETVGKEQTSRCIEWLTNELRASVLITTRDLVRNVRNIPLQPMSPPEAQQFLDGLLRQSQYPDTMRQYADSMLRISESNPLVLQWIVSQVDLAQDPVDVFRELQQGEGDAAKRVFDRSFNLPQTGEDGRSVLLALTLFADSASRASVAFVAGFKDNVKRANDAIARLAALRLVSFGKIADRVRVEGLTREMAAAKLTQSGRQPEFAGKFIQFFSLFTDDHDAPNPSDQELLAAELNNIKVAAALAYEMKLDEPIYSITSVLAPVTGLLVTCGQWDDAIQMNERALELARDKTNERAIQLFSHNLGALLAARGQTLKAEGPLNESLQSAKRNGDPYHAAVTIIELAAIAFIRGDLRDARSLYEQSLQLSSIHGNLAASGVSLHQLGLIAQETGDLDSARTLFVESVRMKQSQPESFSLAKSLFQIGALAEIQQNETEALRAYDFALQILTRLKSPWATGVQELLTRITRAKETLNKK